MVAANLASPELFQDWFAQERLQKTSKELLDRLPGQDDVSLCRRMCVAYWTLHPPASLRLELIQTCLHCVDTRVENYAMAYLAYWRMIDEYPNLSKTNSHLETAEYIPLLMANCVRLKKDASGLALEALAVTQLSIAALHLLSEDYQTALAVASEALFWAKEIKAGVVVGQIHGLLISIHLAMANLESVIDLATKDMGNYLPETDAIYQQVFSAIALAQLGSWRRSLNQLDVLAQRYPLSHEAKDLSACIHASKQQLTFFYEQAGTSDEIIKDHHPHDWLTAALQQLTAAESIPRLTSKQIKQRSEHYEQAISLCLESKNNAPDLRNDIHAAWVTAYAALRQGKTALALGALQAEATPLEGWFDLRILISALQLELASHLNHAALSPLNFEEDIRLIIETVRKIKPASASGLAELVMKWHPLAAAYMGLVPESLPEFRKSTQAIIRVGYSNTVYNLTLPPSFCCELILRSLDFDIQQAQTFQASDLGSSRKKRLELFEHRHEQSYWRPSFSIALLIYGFKKVGQQAYDERAEILFRSYGIKPHVNSTYIGIPMVECLESYTQKLLANEITVHSYAQRVLDL